MKKIIVVVVAVFGLILINQQFASSTPVVPEAKGDVEERKYCFEIGRYYAANPDAAVIDNWLPYCADMYGIKPCNANEVNYTHYFLNWPFGPFWVPPDCTWPVPEVLDETLTNTPPATNGSEQVSVTGGNTYSAPSQTPAPSNGPAQAVAPSNGPAFTG